MKKVMIFFIALFGLVGSVSGFVNLGGDCSIISEAQSCSGGNVSVDNLYISDPTNAHACYDAVSSCYGYKLCCGGVGSMSFTQVAFQDSLVSLSDVDNAHVENSSESNYPVDLGFTLSGSLADCNVRQTSCTGAQEYCLFSMSDPTNAHVGVCGDYTYQVCCFDKTLNFSGEYLNIVSLDASTTSNPSICGDTISDGSSITFDINVDETNGSTIPSLGANISLVLSGTGPLPGSSQLTDTNGDVSFNRGFSDGNYTVYANASKFGFISDDNGAPSCTFEVFDPGSGGSGGSVPPGSYIVYSECYCPSGSDCNDGIGGLDVGVYDLKDNSLVSFTPASLECFLLVEDIPFFGLTSFIIFILILGTFYYNEMFKRKKLVNKLKRVK